MNCREALKLLYDIIDHEAKEIDAQQVEEHLKKCRNCMERYEFEKTFKAFVVEKGQNASDACNIKSDILSKLDEADTELEAGSHHSPFRWVPVMLASAASLVLCLLAAYFINDFYRYQNEIVPFIDAYYAGAENQMGNFDVRPLDFLYENTGIRLNCSDDLITGKIRTVAVDTIMGIPFARVEMSGADNMMITMFVTDSREYHLPGVSSEIIAGNEFRHHKCKKCNLIGTTRGDLTYVIISRPECKTEDMATLAMYF